MKALLIIDMQNGCFNSEMPRYNAEDIITKINVMSDFYRQNEDKIVFIQHDGTAENELYPGTWEWEILPSLVQKPEDIRIVKTANGGFYKTDLNDFLLENKIQDITVMGSATDFCVESTVQAALTLDYNITVIKDGHTTEDKPHASAKQLIDHYNWIWERLSPTKGKIEVVNLEAYLSQKV